MKQKSTLASRLGYPIMYLHLSYVTKYLLSPEAIWEYSSEQRYLVDQPCTVEAATWPSPALPLLESSVTNNSQ